MAACLRGWRFHSRLQVLVSSYKVSVLRNEAVSKTRSLTCARILKKQETVDNSDYDDSQRLSSDRKVTSSLQIDQKLLDVVYGRDQNHELGEETTATSVASYEEYFKQAWQKKVDFKKQDKFRRNAFDDKKRSDRKEDGFVLTQRAQEEDDVSGRRTDPRDHNERIAQKYPDDDEGDERDWRKNIPLSRYGRLGRKAYYYTKKMTKLGKEGKVKEAIEVFDDWMMTQDRVMPSKRTFITLIGIVGRAGYTKKAFQLFRQMKHMGLDPPDHIFTSLFNACANCPMPDYGLKRTNALYHQMKVKGIPMSPITTMAAMKAFALCGDFTKAFQILDENRIPLDHQCLNSLLLSCAVDKKSGFRTALKVWQTMRENNVTPSHNSYNLLMRCARDCGVGDVNTLAQEFDLLPQGQNSEDITPVNFFEARESNSPLLLSGQESSEGENIVTMDDGVRIIHEDFSYVHNDNGLKQSTFIETTGEPLKYFENGHLSDREISGLKEEDLSDEKAIQDVMIICDDEKLAEKRLVVSDESVDKEWWEHVDKHCSPVELSEYFGHNNDPLQNFPHVKDAMTENNDDPITQLAILSSEYRSSSLTTTDSSRSTVSLSDLDTKTGRLALIGGVKTVISHMLHHGMRPDIRMFTEMLSCVQNDADNEAMILRLMEIVGVTPDIDFLNDVMMRRNMRHQSETVKEVLVLMSKLRLTPNMRTYAALALTCHKQWGALDLLEDMEAANVEPNIEIMGHLIYISRLDFGYKLFLLQKMEELGLSPTPRIIAMIEKSIAIAKRNIVKAEKMADICDSIYLTPKYQKRFQTFLHLYQTWLKRTELPRDVHPWERYSVTKSRQDKPAMRAETSK